MGSGHTSREAQAREELGRTECARGVPVFLTGFFLACLLLVWILQTAADRSDASEQRGFEPLVVGCGLGDLIPSAAEITYALAGGEGPGSLADLAAVREVDPDRAGRIGRLQLVNARVLRSIDQFDTCLDERSFFASRVVPSVRGVTNGLLHSGSDNALMGRQGWLFFKPGVDHLTGRPFLDPEVLRSRRLAGNEWTRPVEPDPIPAILELRDRLEERGVALIVMPTPVKAAIYPDRFSSRFGVWASDNGPNGRNGLNGRLLRSSGISGEGGQSVGVGALRNRSFDAFKARLSSAGVSLFDPAAGLMAARREGGDPLYLRTDTHWSPQGVRVTARALKAFIDSAGLLKGHPSRGFERRFVEVSNRGDISVMLRVAEAFSEPSETVTVEPVFDAAGTPWSADPAAPVLLLGDSFTNIYSLSGMGWGTGAGLGAQLSAELGLPIDVISQNDAGAYATRKQLSDQLIGGRDRLECKALVIYQFAARELSFGDWRTGFPMTVGAAPVAPASAGPVTVRGTVSAILQSPAPGTVAYKDCYIPLHLTDLKAEKVALPADEAVVFVWGMLDGELTEYNRLKVGDTVTLPLTPFATVTDAVGAYRHEEFTDPGRLALAAFWGDPRMPGGRTASPSNDGPAPDTDTPGADDISRREPSKEPGLVKKFLDDMAAAYRESRETDRSVIEGKDGWLFLPSEARHLAAGRFWGDAADAVSRATKPENRDPLPAVVDFHRQLKEAGIELLVVPVPAKSLIYADRVAPSVSSPSIPRLDFYHQRFLDSLRAAGVAVVDLTEPLLKAREKDEVYCRQDSHWSGFAVSRVAQILAGKIGEAPWTTAVEKRRFTVTTGERILAGDLWSRLDPRPEKERHRLFFVTGPDREPVSPWRESPVLLLGDSHTLVFHAGDDMHAEGAGLADHLAAALGFPVDLVGVRGSGATPSRVALMRRGDNLKGKKVVIWVFAARELTESRTGWARIPVIR